METKTIYTAIDGKEFTNEKECWSYQYNLIDYDKFTNHIYFVKIITSAATGEVTLDSIIPIVSLQPRELWDKMGERYIYLYVKDKEGIDILRSYAKYFTQLDSYTARYVGIGLNTVVYCGDDEEIINISDEIGTLEEDIKEAQTKIEGYQKLIDAMKTSEANNIENT